MKAHVHVTRSDGFDVDAHFDVDPLQTLALVGPNGAGKTTALLALAGLIGDGLTVDVGKVGVVFQDGLLFPHLTVRDNVGFGSTKDVESLMVDLGVEHLAAQKPASLSGGEAQRVALARTLASEPDVLLLDEPMSALDATAKGEMRRFLKSRFDAFEGPIVIVTHDPLDAFGLADRVSVMEKGRVVQEGTPTELRLRPTTRYVADLVGTNLLEGTAADGVVTHGDHDLQVADVAAAGDVVVQIHPRAVAIHPNLPTGSARNVWQSVVEHVESLGEVARVTFDIPLPLTAEVTTKSVEDLAIRKGASVYVAIKATEIEVRPR